MPGFLMRSLSASELLHTNTLTGFPVQNQNDTPDRTLSNTVEFYNRKVAPCVTTGQAGKLWPGGPFVAG